jgi:hypothetical protein
MDRPADGGGQTTTVSTQRPTGQGAPRPRKSKGKRKR